MVRIWSIVYGCWLLAASAGAQMVAVGTTDGGGSRAVAGGYVVWGAIDGLTLPDGNAGASASFSTIVGVGFYAALAANLIPIAAAQPVWLELAMSVIDSGTWAPPVRAALLDLARKGWRLG